MAKNNSINNATSALQINGTYSFPTADGSANYFLKTDGAGTLGWNTYSGKLIQQVSTSSASVVTCNTAIAIDDTIPQNTEGNEIITLAITPTNASNYLFIEYNLFISAGATYFVTALFQDSTADAIFAANTQPYAGGPSAPMNIYHFYRMTAGTASSTTFKLRGSGQGGTTSYTNADGSGNRYFGGVGKIELKISEIAT